MRSVRVPPGRPAWYVEAPLLVVGYLAFGFVRARVGGEPVEATADARSVQRLEQGWHLAVEQPLNHAMLAHAWTVYLTGAFYRLCLLAVPAVLVWLYLAPSARYRFLRTVLVVMTLLDLVVVWLFPESPPRFAESGIVDYVATHDILGGATLRDPHAGLNLLAAMPSMHIAWTTWCAYAVWSTYRARRAAALAWLFPLATAFVVVATGHHYVVDVVAGVALVGITVGLTSLGCRLRKPPLTSGLGKAMQPGRMPDRRGRWGSDTRIPPVEDPP